MSERLNVILNAWLQGDSALELFVARPETLQWVLSADELEVAGIRLSHEPRRGEKSLICGHLHPAARIAMDGRSTRKPCFVHDNRVLVLPAYGASTGALNILSPAFAGLFHWPALEVVMLGRDRTYRVPVKRLISG